MIFRLIIFLIINFGALAIGGLFTSNGVSSDWYINANKAPWTPPGWMFGAAWTTIMVLFSLYMASLWQKINNKSLLIGLFVLQFILNVGWNPAFFYYHNALVGLIIISGLTFLIGFMLFNYFKKLKLKSVLIVPYFVWLLIATSLNAYIWLQN